MQNIQGFWEIVKEVWRDGYAGIDFSSLITALGIIVFALMIRGIFTKFVINRFIRFAQKSESKIDDQLIMALRGPIRFVPLVIGVYFALSVPEFGDDPDFSAAASKIVRSMIVYNIFWGLYCAISPLAFLLGRLEELFSTEMVNFLIKIMKGLVAGLGAATVLQL